ncbi:disintegrin and metalloproteinase domain-containing protein 12-like [Branchiostoma lanceolatum]|uniref:disintegrin and metalloproteinase domain-containing protein 12-like n=1 Tax=Branchiostoma lanceolatum TaxID=7740 RepID=UPI00345465B1
MRLPVQVFHLLLCQVVSVLPVTWGTDQHQETADIRHSLKYYEITEAYRIEHQQANRAEGNEDLTISLAAFGRNFTLDLTLNRNLIPRSLKRHLCHYQGGVRDLPGSVAVISTCKGVRGSIHVDEDVFFLQPTSSSEHIVFRQQDIQLEWRQGGHCEALYVQVKRDVYSETKYVELILVADNREVQKVGSQAAAEDRMVEVANYVDTFYKPLNIRVALVGVEVWTTNPITVDRNIQGTLDRFLEWRRTTLVRQQSNDNAQLVSGQTFFGGGEIGMAPFASICSSAQSGGVSEDIFAPGPVLYVASTVAHELGHNLGLNHDTGGNCRCPVADSDGGCIMKSAQGSLPAQQFSTCSAEGLRQALERGVGPCLYNVPDPDRLYGGPVCGNGYVEQGEECDCGTIEECNSTCCDPTDCTLLAGAVCDMGGCCQGCQLKPLGELCRQKTTDCDIAEYCSGQSPQCPDNQFIQNGIPCQNTEAYCYNGGCFTHADQCRALWGDGADKAHDICFQSVNLRADQYGHCGKDQDGNYLPCAEKDALCGKLQCQGGDDEPSIGSGFQIISTTVTLPNGQVITCRGVYVDLGGDITDPGLVMAGTKCGQDKVCYNHRCEIITSLFPNVTMTTASWGTSAPTATQTTTRVTTQQPASSVPSSTATGQTGITMTTEVQTTPQGSGHWWISIKEGTSGVLVFFLVLLLAILPLAGLVYFFCHENKDAVKKRVKSSRMSKYMADFKAKKSPSEPEKNKRRKSSQKPMMGETLGSLNSPRLRLPVVWNWTRKPEGHSTCDTNGGVVPPETQANSPGNNAPAHVTDPEDRDVDFTGISNPNYNMVTIDLDETSTAEA